MEENKRKEKDVGTDSSGTGCRTYVITFLCAAAISAVYAVAAGVFKMRNMGVILGYLSNAFTVPGCSLWVWQGWFLSNAKADLTPCHTAQGI